MISVLSALIIVSANYMIPRSAKWSIILYILGALCYIYLLRHDTVQVLLNCYMVVQGLYNLYRLRK